MTSDDVKLERPDVPDGVEVARAKFQLNRHRFPVLGPIQQNLETYVYVWESGFAQYKLPQVKEGVM